MKNPDNRKEHSALTNLPNIGKVLALQLAQVGIETRAQLASVGSEVAFSRIKTIDSDACFSTLCALEGAIQGVRWHHLNAIRKLELKEFYNSTKVFSKNKGEQKL